MPPIAPTPVPAGPAVPDSSIAAPTFDAQYEAFNTWEKDDLEPGMNALATNVYNNAVDTAANATIASNAATAAAASVGAPIWVAGSYVTGSPVYSPINGMVYRRLTPGGSTSLDPSTDPSKWSVVAGGDVTLTGAQTLSNKTLTNPVITDLTETTYVPAAGSAFTVNWANGGIQKFTTNANCTITLPAAAAGKGGLLVIAYGGAHTLTFAGGTLLKYPAGAAPTPTSVNGKKDYYAIVCDDATATSVQDAGRNF